MTGLLPNFHGYDLHFLNRPIRYMNRHPMSLVIESSPRNVRLLLLVGLTAALMQVTDEVDSNVNQLHMVMYWVGRLGAVAGSIALANWVLDRWFTERWLSPAWLKPAVISILLAVIPMTVVEMSLETLVPQSPDQDDSQWREVSMALAFAAEYATIASILLPLNLLLWFLIDGRTAAPLAESGTLRQPAFLAKSAGIRVEDIVALSAEEHYVRIITAAGSELVHHRFGEAAQAMPGQLGMRVHRSWWVADRFVTQARRGSRRWKLRALDALWIPVSDSYVGTARERGLLQKRPNTNTS